MTDEKKNEKGVLRIKVAWVGLACAFVAVAIFAGVVGYSLPPSHVVTTVTDSITTTMTLRLYTSINGNYTLSYQPSSQTSGGIVLDSNTIAVLAAGVIGLIVVAASVGRNR